MSKKSNKKIYLFGLIIACLLIGGLVGFTIGASVTLSWGINKMYYFLDLKGIELDIDEEDLKWGIQRYIHKINTCYPAPNASVFND